MEAVEENAKAFEQLSLRHDPEYPAMLRAIPIVKKFIEDRGFILYGGMALHYALKLHGGQIYDEANISVPDLDFMSPDNVNAAYDLADLLREAGFEGVRAMPCTFTPCGWT